MNLKDQLIKLGYSNPELQDNLRPILSFLDEQPSRRAEVKTAFGFDDSENRELFEGILETTDNMFYKRHNDTLGIRRPKYSKLKATVNFSVMRLDGEISASYSLWDIDFTLDGRMFTAEVDKTDIRKSAENLLDTIIEAVHEIKGQVLLD